MSTVTAALSSESKGPPEKITSPITSPQLPSATLHHPEQPSQPQTTPGNLPTRPPFTPFFTLVTDSTNSTTHHPTNVHYLFSDDDPSVLTTACVRALDPQAPSDPPSNSSSTSAHLNPNRSSSSSSTSKSNAHPSSRPTSTANPARERRILVLDMDENGSFIVSANSLTPSWAIVSTSISPAPTWDDTTSPTTSTSESNLPSFMLKIEGTDGGTSDITSGVSSATGSKGEVAGSGTTDTNFQALMEDFDRRMAVLRTVVGAGDLPGQRGSETLAEGSESV